jgi:hypothetical protein
VTSGDRSREERGDSGRPERREGKEREERDKKDVLVHDNTNSIIQNTFPKNDRIQLWINLILIENRKDRHRISR